MQPDAVVERDAIPRRYRMARTDSFYLFHAWPAGTLAATFATQLKLPVKDNGRYLFTH